MNFDIDLGDVTELLPDEVLYALDNEAQNNRDIDALCRRLEAARTMEELLDMCKDIHWFLCAFWHGRREQFDEARDRIYHALDVAAARLRVQHG
ncbi:hypothetical protein TUM18999_31330 [Pseudomonas tohonis]|uniref:Uncharacterized protein n=1 Tax=Pseudomonas tohonis TaxID=2725477 RepID=A0A6J4E565_9PSED|nr:hypothetical protein [Pseudomonas tohonis]BCG24942.1 hypothetical protein TUM18999_31330 [Pseudomonas tohonis]GJN53817.1 hypothetical protein TUM20286_35690 [Pseudomonas tohonis]